MSELTDAFQSLVSALRHQYTICAPIISSHLTSLRWSLHLSLLSLQEDVLRPFRVYTDHVLLLDSPDGGGWQVLLHVADEQVQVLKVQHLGRGKLSHGLRVLSSDASSRSKRQRGQPPNERKEAKEPIQHLARLPRPPPVAQSLLLAEVRRVLADDLLDDPEWILRDAVKGAKRRCLREGAGMEWCDIWLAEVRKRRPGAINGGRESRRGRERERVPEGRVVSTLARFVP